MGHVPESLPVTEETKELLRQQANQLPEPTVLRLIDLLAVALEDMRQGGDPRLPLELAIVKVTRPHADLSRESLAHRVELLESRILPGACRPTSRAGPVRGALQPLRRIRRLQGSISSWSRWPRRGNAASWSRFGSARSRSRACWPRRRRPSSLATPSRSSSLRATTSTASRSRSRRTSACSGTRSTRSRTEARRRARGRRYRRDARGRRRTEVRGRLDLVAEGDLRRPRGG